MRIDCPFCGKRSAEEFSYLGDANARRPCADSPDAGEQFFDAVYLRANPAGLHAELWYHSSGCRSWLRVTRNTITHEILAVELSTSS